jgi:hypothetical protein
MFVWQPHPSSAITQMLWMEDKQYLMTTAKDKSLKIWSFPKIWYDEEEVKAQPSKEVKPTVQKPKAPTPEKVVAQLQQINLENPLSTPQLTNPTYPEHQNQ